MKIHGKTVLLTGATGGIGLALARGLSAAGADLVLSGRRPEALEEIAAEVGARILVVDLAERSDVDRVAAELGQIDIVVSNAALPAAGTIDDLSQHEIDRALEVNLRAPIALARAVAPGMRERGEGHIVLVASVAGLVAPAGAPLYAATKFGLRGFAHSLRQDLHGSGVGVSVVLPGFVDDVGMCAESGVSVPPLTTVPVESVVGAVSDAIERNRGEVLVAGPALRAGALAGRLAPMLSAQVARLMGAGRTADAMADGLRHNR